jgi:hypothetical protein
MICLSVSAGDGRIIGETTDDQVSAVQNKIKATNNKVMETALGTESIQDVFSVQTVWAAPEGNACIVIS